MALYRAPLRPPLAPYLHWVKLCIYIVYHKDNIAVWP